MTHAMARSSPAPRLASLGVLLWAATSLAMPLDTPTGPAHETDGIAAHEISLQPAGRDFERRRADVCGDKWHGKPCCTRYLFPPPVARKATRCEDYLYHDSRCNCHQYYYYNSAPPPPARARVAPPPHAHEDLARECAGEVAVGTAHKKRKADAEGLQSPVAPASAAPTLR